MPRNQIPVLYLIATLCEPQGVAPGTAADVSDNCRRRWEATEHNLRSPQKLEATATLGQPIPLAAAVVVLEYLPVFSALAHCHLPLYPAARGYARP
jgi:hypothetical protein